MNLSLNDLIALLRAPEEPRPMTTEPMTPTDTPTPAPSDLTAIPWHIDAYSDWCVQAGAEPRIGKIVHGYDPDNGTCVPMQVFEVYPGRDPRWTGPQLRLIDPRTPARPLCMRHLAAPVGTAINAIARPGHTYHLVVECPWQR